MKLFTLWPVGNYKLLYVLKFVHVSLIFLVISVHL